MFSTSELNEISKVVAAQRWLTRQSLRDATDRNDTAAVATLTANIAKLDKIGDSLRRESNQVASFEELKSKDFQRRSSFREQLQRVKREAAA